MPVDVVLTDDKDLNLAGLKVKAMRLPGHTFGSMGYCIREGRQNVRGQSATSSCPAACWVTPAAWTSAPRTCFAVSRSSTALEPDVVLGGHGGGDPDEFIAKGIEAGEATGWSRMTPPKPNPLYGFAQKNYIVAAWLEPIVSAAYGDANGDGWPDVAVLVPSGKGSAVKIYLNQDGNFQNHPDAVVELPDLSDGWKLRTLQVGPDNTIDFFASSQDQAMLLLSQQDRLRYEVVPLRVIRGAHVAGGDFDNDGRIDLVDRLALRAGVLRRLPTRRRHLSVRQTKSPTRNYMDMELIDVNGDKQGRPD